MKVNGPAPRSEQRTQEPRHALRTGSVGGPQDQAKHARSAGAKQTKQTKQNANAVAQPGRTQL